MAKVWTVLDVLRWTTGYFERCGIDSPRLDTELLMGAVLRLDRVGLYLNYDRPLVEEELGRIRALVARRATREPLQYILGETEFWSLPFAVAPEVLIPRPDTEVLVEEALKRGEDACHILDLGTGSGIVAIALAHELPRAQVSACDLSSQALELARANARSNGVEERITFALQDFAQALAQGNDFDLVVSNPPYVADGDMEQLMPEVRDHEPHLALAGGPDGLDALRVIIRNAPCALKSGGWLLVEVGQGQADAVEQLFREAGFHQTFQRRDYAGIPRVVGGCKP